jgi:hypothetical protein
LHNNQSRVEKNGLGNSLCILGFRHNYESRPVFGAYRTLGAKSLTLWARLLCPLAALSELDIPRVRRRPCCLVSAQITLRE